MDEKQRLLEIIKQHALKLGNFTLASGATSNYYIDARIITTHPEGAYLIGKIIFTMLKEEGIGAIGGPVMGAVPICSAVSLVSYLEGKPIPAFFVRSSVKKYGTQKCIEGNLNPGSRVVMVDDVITTAGSVLTSIEQVVEFGCEVVKVICVVDREESARQRLAERGYVLEPLFTKSDLGV
jgi:orotate phosphoribosyltransferase